MKSAPSERNVNRFNEDVAAFGGYAYTTSGGLSCRLANRRVSDAIRQAVDLSNKRVIDVGCGDGTYSVELLDAGAASVLGIDAAEEAVSRARKLADDRASLRFETVSVQELATRRDYFDVAIIRGVLHHLDAPEAAIQAVCRIATEVVVVEPNGYNPVLKVLEKVSPYHIAHDEKSYPPRRLDSWFQHAGGQVVASSYIGLVPMFCPDWMAKLCKRLEPFLERIPVIRQLACAQYVQRVVVSQQ